MIFGPGMLAANAPTIRDSGSSRTSGHGRRARADAAGDCVARDRRHGGGHRPRRALGVAFVAHPDIECLDGVRNRAGVGAPKKSENVFRYLFDAVTSVAVLALRHGVLQLRVCGLVVVSRSDVFYLRFCEIELGLGDIDDGGKSQVVPSLRELHGEIRLL